MTTLRELRKLASSIGIKKYSRLTKSQLEAEISKLNAATAEITTASDNDNASASQPAQVASTHSETTALNDLPAKFLNADSEPDFDARLALLEKNPAFSSG